MTSPNYPSENPAHRRADIIVHTVGLIAVLICATILLRLPVVQQNSAVFWGALVYIFGLLASNLASFSYHFLPWHDRRQRLRRVDHAAIYLIICGTFTPAIIYAGAGWTKWLLALCWLLAFAGMGQKLFGGTVKSRWSTAAFLALGALGIIAMLGMQNVPSTTVWCVLAGAVCYVIGAAIYSRKTLPYRYATWHGFGNMGGILMFFGIWALLTRAG